MQIINGDLEANKHEHSVCTCGQPCDSITLQCLALLLVTISAGTLLCS